MSRLSERSVNYQVRALVISVLLVFPLLTGLVVVQLANQNRAASLLTLALGPAFDANNAAMIDMTEANAGWSQVMGGETPVIRYRLKQELVKGDFDTVGRALSSTTIDADQRRTYEALLDKERATATAWFAAASRAEAELGTSLGTSSTAEADAVRAFRDFRDANRSLFAALKVERDHARSDARARITFTMALVGGTALVTLALLAAWGRIFRGSVVRPLERLREVVDRQRDGDRQATAEPSGATEVRALATELNGLTRANAILEEQQRAVLASHELVIEVGRLVHAAPDVEEALDSVCARLGEGLAADRVLLYTHDDDGEISEHTQWHRPDLPDLPRLPPSLGPEVQRVTDELRSRGTFFGVPDFLDPQVQSQERAQGFYRATGARSLLMVPVGSGERGLGVLALMMVDGPRRWRRHEIQAVQQCAGYVAQSVIALELSELQAEQVRRLTELDSQKTDFMATVSHELRTPLTSIVGYLEMLEDGDYGELSQRQVEALGTVERNAVRLRGMIEDLLVLNKIEASGVQPSLATVSVASLVAATVEVLGPQAAVAEVSLQTAPVDPNLMVSVEPRHLERALLNLGSNAVKFTPAGGRVELTAVRDGDDVVVTVADSGIGIPAADLDQLFGRFFRASNATAAAIPGTGLGLAIVRQIVEGHDGQLTLESTEGEGTTVRIRLPLVTPDPADAAGNDEHVPAV